VATHRAIELTCDAIVELLRDNYPTELPDTTPLQFAVATRDELADGLDAGVTLFLYRVFVDGTERSPDGRTRSDGRRHWPQLPVQLHFLLTAWGAQASLQHFLTGWMMRVMEDHPVLPAGLLNRRVDDDAQVFWPDETVELSAAPLAADELYQLWDLIGPSSYQLSVPYQARGVRIESTRLFEQHGPVVERQQRYEPVAGGRP
jgi:hypothetical protein